jgi:hypothetical protein
VFEFTMTLPTFCNFLQLDQAGATAEEKQAPASSVSFALDVNFKALVSWVEQSFILTEELNAGAGGLQAKFSL